MQPDPSFLKACDRLTAYCEGTVLPSLESRDTASWQPESWGVVRNSMERAYDRDELQRCDGMPR